MTRKAKHNGIKFSQYVQARITQNKEGKVKTDKSPFSSNSIRLIPLKDNSEYFIRIVKGVEPARMDLILCDKHNNDCVAFLNIPKSKEEAAVNQLLAISEML